MRKILLGTTAVVGAALLAPTSAMAQQAPTVRLGGFVDALFGYVQQSSSANTTGFAFPITVASQTGGGNTVDATTYARSGKFDFATIAGVNVFVDGKAANGLTYGAELRLIFNGMEGRALDNRRASTPRSAASVDEAFVYVASPTLGQVRFGDEDGAYALMVSGIVTDFGTGGVYGAWENFGTRANQARTMTAPGGLGDNTKIIYLSPQFFGFDFGGSFAWNTGEMSATGCNTDSWTQFCDRSRAATGISNQAISYAGGGPAARRNEFQLAARWRGNVAGVGLAATVAYIGAGAAREIPNASLALGQTQVRWANNINVLAVGAQATFAGFTLGANWEYGDANFFWGNTFRGDRPMNQIFVGGSYTNGPITIGANYVTGSFEGGSRRAYNVNTGLFSDRAATDGNRNGMRRQGVSVGGTYRVAPGLSLVAEYTHFTVRERGRDLDPVNAGVQDKGVQNVFLAGARLAF